MAYQWVPPDGQKWYDVCVAQSLHGSVTSFVQVEKFVRWLCMHTERGGGDMFHNISELLLLKVFHSY